MFEYDVLSRKKNVSDVNIEKMNLEGKKRQMEIN